jgi:hypothetical protein
VNAEHFLAGDRLRECAVSVGSRVENGVICIDNVRGNCDWCNEVLLE